MKDILIILATIFSLQLTAQNEMGLYLMPHLIQNNSLNPAIRSPHKIDISLPSVYFNGINSSFKNNYFAEKSGNKVIIKPTRAIDKMKERGNMLQGNFELSILSIAFKMRKVQISLYQNLHVDAYFQYPKNMAELAWYGNAPFVGETLQIAPSADFWMYNEYGIGISFPINEKLNIGGRLKLLTGYLGMKTAQSNARLYTDPDHYRMTVESDILLHTSGFDNFLSLDNQHGILRGDIYDDLITTRNQGYGLDWGVQYQLSEQLSFSASILDIGNINWRQNLINNRSEGQFVYEGLEIQPFNDGDDFDFEEVRDSIENIFDFQETNAHFSTKLPRKIYLAGQFKNEDNLALGAVIFAENYKSSLRTSFALSIQKRWKNVLSFGTTLGLPNHGGINFGLNGSLQFWGIQLYFISDNILPAINPFLGQNFNARVGINIAISGKKKKMKQKEIPEEIAPTPTKSSSDEPF